LLSVRSGWSEEEEEEESRGGTEHVEAEKLDAVLHHLDAQLRQHEAD
jgi:hypothetical protein